MAVGVRLVPLSDESHEALWRDVTEGDAVKARLIHHAGHLEEGGLDARSGVEHPSEDILVLEVQSGLAFLGFEGDEPDPVRILPRIIDDGGVRCPELIAGGGDAVVAQLRGGEVLLDDEITKTSLAPDHEVPADGPARLVELLFELSDKAVHILKRVGVFLQADCCLELGSRQTQGGVRLREVDHEQHTVELLFQQRRCRLKGFDANSCHIRLSSQHIKFVVLLAKDIDEVASLGGELPAEADAYVLLAGGREHRLELG